MKTMRTVIALAFAAALVACNQQDAAKSETPAEGAATSADATPAADTGAKPGEAAPAGDGAKPDE
ncbi:MAG TPA: hypothetical protein VEF55_10515, partial [Candidatus Binatia bacterium]|nr:hypothetical protein [Candidatus Binatia bacterium]